MDGGALHCARAATPLALAGGWPAAVSPFCSTYICLFASRSPRAMRCARPAPRKPQVDRADVRGMQRALHSCRLPVGARCFFGAYLPVVSALMQRAVPALTLRWLAGSQ